MSATIDTGRSETAVPGVPDRDDRRDPGAPEPGAGTCAEPAGVADGADRRRRYESLNRGYDAVFRSGRLTLGLVAPIEAYPDSPVPRMQDHLGRVQLAEALGFRAVWLRDVPFNVPAFGDAGQPYDPFVYLGLLAGQTSDIALGVASIVLPLRHPAHVAKAAASVDVLSGGRLLLGVASGDRPQEYPALGRPYDDRGAQFRASHDYIRAMAADRPEFASAWGDVGGGIDLLPKPAGVRLPILITGGSQQDPGWIAGHGDGWMIYPRAPALQARILREWRQRSLDAGRAQRPAMQPLYVDLVDDPSAPPQPIHLGFRLGVDHLRTLLLELEAAGLDHVALNLRFNRADVPTTLRRLSDDVLAQFG